MVNHSPITMGQFLKGYLSQTYMLEITPSTLICNDSSLQAKSPCTIIRSSFFLDLWSDMACPNWD